MRIQSYTNQPQNSYQYAERVNFASEVSPAEKSNKGDLKASENTFSSISVAILATISCFVMLSRGFQKNAKIYLNKFKNYLEQKQEHSLSGKTSKWNKFYEYAIRKTNSFINKSESINNITSLKDILFMRLMYKTKPTKQIHDSITNYFEKISRKTIEDSKKQTERNFGRMNRILDELDRIILQNSKDEIIEYNETKYSKKELIQLAKGYREDANILMRAFFNKNTMEGRYKYINDVTSTLYSNFWDLSFKDFWSKNNKFKREEMWQTFIAADQIKGDKTDLAKIIAIYKNAITYSSNNQNNRIHELINALDGIIPYNDKDGIKIIKRLEWFADNPEGLKNNQELFFKELSKLKEHKITANVSKSVTQVQEQFKNTTIELITQQINDNRPGAIQDMLSIYYKLAPFELSESGGLNAIKKAVESFEKSVDLETIEFFDKVRDLKLGSAPTDVLTILLSFITLSVGMGRSKDKDTKKSIMLKSGIPIVGGIATAMYSTLKLVSGGKSLALGLLSGIALNRFGVIADNLRKKHNYSQYKNV